MSKSFSASENSSTPDLVRSSRTVDDGNHVPSAASKTKPKATTGSALAQHDGADAILQRIADGPDHEKGHPSILGSNGVLDNYEGSDPNTPRLPPIKSANTDLENMSQEVAVSLDLPDQSSKSLISSQLETRRYLLPYSGTAAKIFSSSLSEPGTQTPDKASGSDQVALLSSYSQDRSHIKSWLERSQQAYTLPPTNDVTPLPYILRSNSHGFTSNERMSGAWSQEGAQKSVGQGLERPIAMSAREEAFSEEKRTRSSSRSSQTRVEKRIEATVADAEPSSHARSRKSSHVLGLFKENKSSHDVRKVQERQRTTSDTSIDAYSNGNGIRADEAHSSGHGGRTSSGETHEKDEYSGTVEEPPPNLPLQEQRHIQQKKEPQLHQQLSQTSLTATTSANSLKKSRSDTDLTIDRFESTIVKGQYEPECGPEQKIPPRLLEEIRDYHNLTTPFHDKFKSTQPKSTGINLVSRDKQTTNRYKEAQLPRKENFDGAKLLKATGEPENEEEESEHISSALYYPHQAPSPDALEDISIDDARKHKDTRLESQPNLPDPALSVSSGDEKAEDVNIALQVHNKNRYLHGDLQKARPSSTEPDGEGNSETGLSSASDSEYESLDETKRSTLHEESSLTDDAEATPRASPKPKQSYLLSRPRKAHRGPKAPIGAVELKPYNHQVGGHTTVFRFSKRAVCKQLTNRENEFYEVIERQHPDLLKFLPRYALHASVFNLSI